MNIADEKRKIIIFGQGIIGRTFHGKYFGQLDFFAFCDNDDKKHNTRCRDLDVLSANEIGLLNDCVVVVCVRNHNEVTQQLFNYGIKAFWLYCEVNEFEPVYIDFRNYESLEVISNRVCLLENPGVGESCYAIKKYYSGSEIDFVFVESPKKLFTDSYCYYLFHTSSLMVTQVVEHVFNKPRMELWHGFTIKALWECSNDEQTKDSFKNRAIHTVKAVQAIASYSKLYNDLFNACVGGILAEKFTITGMPRNDILIREKNREQIENIFHVCKGDKIVIYAPTFREHEVYGYRDLNSGVIFAWEDYDAPEFEQFLCDNNITLLVKIHPGEKKRYHIEETEHIRLVRQEMFDGQDISFYHILACADMLISDYSSIWVDFLLTDKPLAFAVRDLEDYKRVHGLMIDPFEAWVPGETVVGIHALQVAIKENLLVDGYAEKRRILTRLYHRYIDGNSTERVIKLIKHTLNKIND